MGNITVAPEADMRNNNCDEVYLIQRTNMDSKPITLVYNKEDNILYEYIYSIKDRE